MYDKLLLVQSGTRGWQEQQPAALSALSQCTGTTPHHPTRHHTTPHRSTCWPALPTLPVLAARLVAPTQPKVATRLAQLSACEARLRNLTSAAWPGKTHDCFKAATRRAGRRPPLPPPAAAAATAGTQLAGVVAVRRAVVTLGRRRRSLATAFPALRGVALRWAAKASRRRVQTSALPPLAIRTAPYANMLGVPYRGSGQWCLGRAGAVGRTFEECEWVGE